MITALYVDVYVNVNANQVSLSKGQQIDRRLTLRATTHALPHREFIIANTLEQPEFSFETINSGVIPKQN